jgi:hypothetical protein
MNKAKLHPRLWQGMKWQDSTLDTRRLSRNKERAIKHWNIAASAGCYRAMHELRLSFEVEGIVSRESIDSILTAYNNSCAEMRSESRETYIRFMTENRLNY